MKTMSLVLTSALVVFGWTNTVFANGGSVGAFHSSQVKQLKKQLHKKPEAKAPKAPVEASQN